MLKKMLFAVFLLFFCANTYAQVTVKGRIIDHEGTPMPFVSVGIKGSSQGTTSDSRGNYSISSTSKNDVIVYSFVGYETQEMTIGDRTTINVTMDTEATALDEVIVVAYGTATKATFTGSASAVSSNILEKRQTSSVTKALDGTMAGVQIYSSNGQPGKNAKVRIRGIGSINASSDPLYVVDGMPFDGDLNTLNNSDIESMTVLKDAAANSLYGARGANGVIVITTKKGKSGQAKVTFDGRMGQNSRAIGNYDVLTTAKEFYELYFDAARNRRFFVDKAGTYEEATAWTAQNIFSEGSYNGGLVTGNGKIYNSYDVPESELFDPITGKISSKANLLYQDNWTDEIFSKGKRQEYNLSVSGGDTKKNYYLSFGYLSDDGIVDASNFNRYTFKANIEQEITNWFKAGAIASYSKTDMDFQDLDETAGVNMFYLVNNMAPIYTIWERDKKGNIIYEKDGVTPVYSFDRPFSSDTNPIASQKLDIYNTEAAITSVKGFGEIKFLKNFKFRMNVGIDDFNTRLTLYNNHLYGQFKDYNGYLFKNSRNIFSVNVNQLFTWSNKFDKHSVDVLAGHESYNMRNKLLEASKQNFVTPGLSQDLDDAIANPKAYSSTNEYSTEGYLSRLQYNYDEKYFFSASYRRDGSSVFHPDHRWGNFWSVGGAWNLNKESFLNDINWIDLLKIKSSYGTQGNDAIYYPNKITRNYYAYKDQYLVVNAGDQLSLERYYIGSKDLKWEENHNFNAGFEFEIFNKRLFGGIEYFQRTSKNLLFNVPVPVSSGSSFESKNAGNMRNSGIEFEVSSNLIQTTDFDLNISLNVTHFSNKILKLDEKNKEKGIIIGSRRMTEGKSYYNMFLAKYAGVNPETGAPKWYVKDQATGNIAKDEKGELLTSETYDADNRFDLGSALPNIFGGLTINLNYKGFDFSISSAYQIGGKILDYQYFTLMDNSGEVNWHKDALKSWTPNNKNTDVPRRLLGKTSEVQLSDWFLVDASYFSINNITLGYSFPSSLIRKIHLNSLRVYGNIDNVALFSKRKGFDPRVVIAGASVYSAYSPIRVISLGVNLTF